MLTKINETAGDKLDTSHMLKFFMKN